MIIKGFLGILGLFLKTSITSDYIKAFLTFLNRDSNKICYTFFYGRNKGV